MLFSISLFPREGNGGGIIFQQCLDNGVPLWMCKPIMKIIFTFPSHHPAKEDPVEHFFFLREVLVKDSHPSLYACSSIGGGRTIGQSLTSFGPLAGY